MLLVWSTSLYIIYTLKISKKIWDYYEQFYTFFNLDEMNRLLGNCNQGKLTQEELENQPY